MIHQYFTKINRMFDLLKALDYNGDK